LQYSIPDETLKRSYFKNNIQLLTEHNSYLASLIKSAGGGDYRVINSKAGPPTLIWCDSDSDTEWAFHSRYDPLKEAHRRIAALNTMEKTSVLLILGLGLGYILDEARKQFTDIPIIVIEPSATRFYHYLSNDNHTDVLSDTSIFWLVGMKPRRMLDQLEQLKYTISFLQPTIIQSPLAAQLESDRFEGLSETIKKLAARELTGISTSGYFGPLWIRNTLDNIHAINNSGDLYQYINAFNGKPGILIAAGPGLDAHTAAIIPNGVSICTAPALPYLEQLNIKPNFVIAVDAGYANCMHIAATQWRDIPLIAEPSVHPQVLRLWKGPILFIDFNLPLNTLLFPNILPALKSAGTVTAAALQCLLLFGCSSINCIGQDFAYVDRKFHCPLNAHESRWYRQQNRTLPVEMLYEQHWRHIQKEYTDGYRCSVITDARLNFYRGWIEDFITDRHLTSITTYNGRGARIRGIDATQHTPAGKNIRIPHPRKKVSFTPTENLHELKKIVADALKHTDDFSTYIQSLPEGYVPVFEDLIAAERFKWARSHKTAADRRYFINQTKNKIIQFSEWLSRIESITYE